MTQASVATDDSAEEVLLRATTRDIAARCQQIADPNAAHDPCWGRLESSGLTELRDVDASGHPVGTSSDAAVVVEEMARSACSASVLTRAVWVPELIRLAGIKDTRILDLARAGQLTLVFDPGLRTVSSSGVAWDSRSATHALGVAAPGEITLCSLGQAGGLTDLTRSEREVLDSTAIDGALDSLGRDRLEAMMRLTLAADSLGAASFLFDRSLAYAKERVQYGRVIGSFQAVQHILADGYWRLEALRSTILYGAWALDAEDSEAAAVCEAARAFAASQAQHVVRAAMQVFGGISITWEHPAHVYLRRVLMNGQLLTPMRAADHPMTGSGDHAV